VSPLAHRRHRGTGLVLAALLVTGAAAPASALSPQPPDRAAPDTAAPAPAAVLDPGLPRAGRAEQPVIVTGGSGVAAAVARAGGRVTADLPLVDGVAARVPAAGLAALAADPATSGVTMDRRGRFVEYAYDDTTTASNFARTSQATRAWADGNYGRGVGVAVIDTGVSPMPDLAGRLVHGPDLSGEGTTIDSYGHGTVMAGAIAGNGNDSVSRSGGAFTGIAPMSHIVSVKTAGRNGVVDVSTILQAMHWVSAYREQYNIRVLNLSWGVGSTQSPSADPLNYAVQRLWAQGIVVVVAAGNSGPNPGSVTKPGDDPVVLTVGAFNDQGDADPANDSIPGWSSRGPTAAGHAKPDLVAPGRTIISARAYGSVVETNNPKALLPPSYIKGSGTSQAAAVTSGAAALLLAARPGLTPDQVKALLMGSAAPISGVAGSTQGRGRLQLAGALTAPAPTGGSTPTPGATGVLPSGASGLGQIEHSRGGRNVVASCNGVQTEIRGEIDVRCERWAPQAWSGITWKGDAWTGITWKGSEWTGITWKGVGWSDATWNGITWKGGTWNTGTWQGSTSWNGGDPVTSAWSGITWKDSTWAGITWKEAAWTTGEFTNSEWTGGHWGESDFLSAYWGGGPPVGRRLPGERFLPAGAQVPDEPPPADAPGTRSILTVVSPAQEPGAQDGRERVATPSNGNRGHASP
jgi:serine protease AprX